MRDVEAQTPKEQLRSQHAALANFSLFAFRCERIDEPLRRLAARTGQCNGVGRPTGSITDVFETTAFRDAGTGRPL